MNRAEKVFESRGMDQHLMSRVDVIKHRAAALWECLDEIPVPPGNSEAGRLISLAKTELESCVMWGAKACSRSKIVSDCEPPVAPAAEMPAMEALNQPTSSEVAQAVSEAAEVQADGTSL